MQIRGGTSKGAYFLAADLPEDPSVRDAVLVDHFLVLLVTHKIGVYDLYY